MLIQQHSFRLLGSLPATAAHDNSTHTNTCCRCSCTILCPVAAACCLQVARVLLLLWRRTHSLAPQPPSLLSRQTATPMLNFTPLPCICCLNSFFHAAGDGRLHCVACAAHAQPWLVVPLLRAHLVLRVCGLCAEQRVHHEPLVPEGTRL
jgi:hypothetical protein